MPWKTFSDRTLPFQWLCLVGLLLETTSPGTPAAHAGTNCTVRITPCASPKARLVAKKKN